MIIAKPNPQTLFSFSIFALASGALIYWNASIYFSSNNPQWYNFCILILLVPILTYVLYRLLFKLKRIELGNNQITVRYLLYGKNKGYPISEVKSWREQVVKVGKNSTYKEVELVFAANKKVTLGKKEYTDYEKVIAYLRKKLPRREIIGQ